MQGEGRNHIMKIIMYPLHRMLSGDQIKEPEMGEKCSIHGKMKKKRYKRIFGKPE
jgi:hypothetical protein